ncbi:hypothetical protein EUX98_g2038 [Antrodiella citrinella]|uniref:WW domain-containing protein n=1 Tax=Antrodiella citrinella TaxID=2447956 RepID=A0A4V3XJ95_9APHY|nr:hypothetical protein EUX98_g2038 [Antrodiella citrinella]
MSSQPPLFDANGRPVNPDRRELPYGWIEQYDKNVLTHAEGPASFAPPPFAPPPPPPPPQSRGYPYSQGPYAQQGPPQGGWGYQGPPPGYGQGNWGPPQGQSWGAPQGSYGYQQGPPQGYPAGPPAQQVVIINEDDRDRDRYDGYDNGYRHHGGGGGGLGLGLAAGGAGLLGGVLLGEALENNNNNSFDQGFIDGEMMGMF